jgi:predicted ATPase
MKQFQSFGLDTSNQCLLRNGAPVDLAPKPFAVLRYLVENPGRLITHDELLDALWPETYVQPQVLRTYMLELRKVLGDDAACPRFIQTLPKRGYRFVATVTEGAGLAAAMGAAQAPTEARLPQIVGRELELDRLTSELRQAAEGLRRVVIVTGEAGIGKTALIDAFCRQIASSIHVTVARGQCVQGLGVTDEYYPVTEALCQLCAGPDGEAACRVLSRVAPAWLTHSSEFDAAALTAARPGAKDRMLGDLCIALEELAAERPIIFVFEDLHWADDSTLNLISALARRRARARLMLLATCTPCSGASREGIGRPGSSEDALKELRQDLLMRRLAIEMELTRLRKPAVRDLLTRELEQESLPQGLTDFVYRRSEGNPLFVLAVVEHLVSEGVLVRDGGGSGQWQQGEPFPQTEAAVPNQLARMIELAIERLGDEDRRVLEAASLMNVAFPAWAVAAALEKDMAETEEACDDLARRLHFVVRAGQDELPDGTSSAFYVFAHGLYREVLYQRQAAARRARRHIRIAERLGQLFVGREADVARERAMHYEAAGERDRAASVLLAAAPEAQAGVC